MAKTTLGYKFITSAMKSYNGNQTWELGKWYKHDGKLELCESGFHACEKPLDSLEYVYGDRWFMVEARGDMLKGDDKFVAQEMRLVKEIDIKSVAVRFAMYAAQSCLENYEKRYPNDKRPRAAIEAAEKYIDNPTEENQSAASAAQSAARSAAKAKQNRKLKQIINEHLI